MDVVGTNGTRGARIFSFPDPVDEISARLVAGCVALLAVIAFVSGWDWLVAVIAYGFLARVLSGPTLSPLGQLMTRVLRPRLPIAAKLVPGPPKRFAQAIGALFTTVATVLALAFDQWTAVRALLACVIVAATLEPIVGYCVGCKVFAVLIRVGVIPESVCERCSAFSAPR
jgi:hypothetical protein